MLDVKFTTRDLLRLKATGQRETVVTGKYPGLTLLMLPSGTKTFYHRYRDPVGKSKWLKLGKLTQAYGVDEAVTAWKVESVKPDPQSEKKKARAAAKGMLTFQEAAEQWKGTKEWAELAIGTQRTYKTLLKTMWPKLMPMPLDVIEPHHLKAIQADCKRLRGPEPRKPLSPRWFNQGLAVVSCVYSYCAEIGLKVINPATATRTKRGIPAVRERYLTRPELKRLGNAMSINPHPQAVSVIRLLLFTGCRASEILRMQWEDIDNKRGIIYVYKHKTRASTGMKTIPLNPEVKEVLATLPRKGDYIFPAQSSRNRDPHLKNPRHTWGVILADAKIKDYHLHDLRHQYAASLVDAGETLFMVQTLLGHVTPVTTLRYAKLSKKPQAKASAKASGNLAKLLG